MDRMGNAQMGATTDVMNNVLMGCMDDSWMGTMKGVMYDVLTDGDFTRFSYR